MGGGSIPANIPSAREKRHHKCEGRSGDSVRGKYLRQESSGWEFMEEIGLVPGSLRFDSIIVLNGGLGSSLARGMCGCWTPAI